MKKWIALLTAGCLLTGCAPLVPSPHGDVPVSETVVLSTQFPVYDNSIDENELANMHKRLSERYNAILKSSGIKSTAISARNNTVYDLSGRLQEKEPQRGIYIINGKKRMIK